MEIARRSLDERDVEYFDGPTEEMVIWFSRTGHQNTSHQNTNGNSGPAQLLSTAGLDYHAVEKGGLKRWFVTDLYRARQAMARAVEAQIESQGDEAQLAQFRRLDLFS
jgi:hypothetical protein